MKKTLKIYLTILTLLLIITVACKKNNIPYHESGAGLKKTESTAISNEQLHAETIVLEDFHNALEGVSTASINDIASISYQSTLAYISLSNASVTLLQQADILDSLKFHLNITSNSDPRIILAARLVNEMITNPPGSSVPGWVDCVVQAGIGVSIETIYGIFQGGTIAAVGQAIKHMGYSWFAKTIGSTFAKVLTGVGGAIALAQFTWCMVKEYGSQEILPTGLEPFVNSLPTSFFNDNKNYWNFHKPGFMNYMANTSPSIPTADCEWIYEYVYESGGDPAFIGTGMVSDYFLSISTSPLPIP